MKLARRLKLWLWRVSGAQQRIYTLESALSNETAEHAETKDRLRKTTADMLAMHDQQVVVQRRKTDTVGGRVS